MVYLGTPCPCNLCQSREVVFCSHHRAQRNWIASVPTFLLVIHVHQTLNTEHYLGTSVSMGRLATPASLSDCLHVPFRCELGFGVICLHGDQCRRRFFGQGFGVTEREEHRTVYGRLARVGRRFSDDELGVIKGITMMGATNCTDPFWVMPIIRSDVVRPSEAASGQHRRGCVRVAGGGASVGGWSGCTWRWLRNHDFPSLFSPTSCDRDKQATFHFA